MVIRISDVRHERGDYASLDDRMLVLDFQAGHPEAFVEIHNRYGNLARHVCRRLLANAHDTDEAFQETMIRVFQGLYRFNGRYALQPWISRIATNVSLDMIRTNSRRPQFHERAVEEHEHAVVADGPEEEFERLVERDLVLSVLSDLPDTHRRALILRELEGRSHREIGTAMGISPSQAKALIHRAKGSFRRRWMEKAAERSGVAGIALLPLLWLARLADTARRVADRAAHAAQAAQAAAPEVVSSAASSTVVSAGGSGLGERVLAAGMTLLVAGGVTVGAATIAKHRGNDDAPVRAEGSAPTVVAPVPDPDVRESQPRLDQLPPKEAQGPPEVREDPELVQPTPDEETPTEAPPPASTTEPSPEPTQEPPTDPTPVPPPAWTGSFGIAWTSNDLCGCGPALALLSSTSEGGLVLPEGAVQIVQTVRGAATDAEGDPAWLVSAEVRFDLRQAGGDVAVSFTLERRGVKTRFIATGFATEIAGDLAAGEAVSYAFAGDYTIVGPGAETSPIRTSGSFRARVVVWTDGSTPVLTQISLVP